MSDKSQCPPDQSPHQLTDSVVSHDDDSVWSARFYLPSEIWSAIFEIGFFPTGDLRSVSLVQRSFRELARPLLFNVLQITVHTFTDFEHDCKQSVYQTQEWLDRFGDRLAFMTSHTIAPVVKKVLIHICASM